MPEERATLGQKLAAFLRKGPTYAAAYAGWRARRWLAARRAERPAWPSGERVLAAARLPGGIPASPSGLRERFASRRIPGPLFDPARLRAIAEAVPEPARAETLARAGEVLEKRFRYRGREVAFPSGVDWGFAPGGNLDWNWDLNRHHFFPLLGRAYLYSGDERYAAGFLELLRDWMERNPPGPAEAAWRSPFEVGVRAANWCWAHAFFLRSPSVDDRAHLDLVTGLFAMGEHLDRNLERHAWNNHLLLEAKALAMLGLLYPEFEPARRWRRVGLRALEAQLRRQVLPDGVHSERSSLYHEIVASELLEHLVVLEVAGEGAASPHASLVRDALGRMAGFLQAIARVDGSRPLLGDASAGDLHVRYDVLWGLRALEGAGDRVGRGPPSAPWLPEATVWLLAARGDPPRLAGDAPPSAAALGRSVAFPVGGYCILQAGSGETHRHLVLDCGPFGDPVVPGHGHADALSADVAVGPSHVLVDPGSYSAHLGKRWRNFFRGTPAHNALVVDGKDQSQLAGVREVYRPASARVVTWSSSGAVDVFSGEHDGYRRLRPGIRHRRTVVFAKPRWWLFADRVTGRGVHRYDLLFHLHPLERPAVDPETGAVTARDASGRGVALVPLGPWAVSPEIVEGAGDEAVVAGPIQGWVSFVSGSREPAPVVRYRFHGAPPLTFATLVVPLDPGIEPPRVERLGAFGPALEGFPVEEIAAGRIAWGAGRETFLVSPLGEPLRTRGPIRAGDIETDGGGAIAFEDPSGELRAGAVLGGTWLRWRRREVAAIESSPGPGYAAFEIDGEALRVFTDGGLGGAVLAVEAPRASRAVRDGAEAPLERAGSFARVRLG